MFQGLAQSNFLAFFLDKTGTGLVFSYSFFGKKIEPDWEKLVYIGLVLGICQIQTSWDQDWFKFLQNTPKNIKNDQDLTELLKIYYIFHKYFINT